MLSFFGIKKSGTTHELMFLRMCPLAIVLLPDLSILQIPFDSSSSVVNVVRQSQVVALYDVGRPEGVVAHLVGHWGRCFGNHLEEEE